MKNIRSGLFLIIFFCGASLSGCLDRSDKYSDIEAARKGGVFDKGWLPDFLPESAYDLNVITSVESAAGRGDFRFNPQDYPDFHSKTLEYDGSMSKVDNDNQEIRSLLEKKYEPRLYSSGATRWIFLCDAKLAICKFFVWQK